MAGLNHIAKYMHATGVLSQIVEPQFIVHYQYSVFTYRVNFYTLFLKNKNPSPSSINQSISDDEYYTLYKNFKTRDVYIVWAAIFVNA